MNNFCASAVEFFNWHKWQQYDKLRLGQRFCNLYIKSEWTELYYQINDVQAMSLIDTWLRDNCYTEELPQPLNNGAKVPTYPGYEAATAFRK